MQGTVPSFNINAGKQNGSVLYRGALTLALVNRVSSAWQSGMNVLFYQWRIFAISKVSPGGTATEASADRRATGIQKGGAGFEPGVLPVVVHRFDDASAEADFTVIENDGLAGCDCALCLLEANHVSVR